MASLREKFLAATPPGRTVHVSGFGDVDVHGMSVSVRDMVQSAMLARAPWRATVLKSCCTVDGAPLFEPDDDVGAIAAEVVEPLIDAALDLSNVSDADREELEGN